MTQISLKRLRRLIREEIGRNYHTIDNDPYSFLDYPGIEVEIYVAPEANGWYAQVTNEFDESLDTPLRLFADEASAQSFARNKAEEINRYRLSRDLYTKTPSNKIY